MLSKYPHRDLPRTPGTDLRFHRHYFCCHHSLSPFSKPLPPLPNPHVKKQHHRRRVHHSVNPTRYDGLDFLLCRGVGGDREIHGWVSFVESVRAPAQLFFGKCHEILISPFLCLPFQRPGNAIHRCQPQCRVTNDKIGPVAKSSPFFLLHNQAHNPHSHCCSAGAS
jgi:hypothetical protein